MLRNETMLIRLGLLPVVNAHTLYAGPVIILFADPAAFPRAHVRAGVIRVLHLPSTDVNTPRDEESPPYR